MSFRGPEMASLPSYVGVYCLAFLYPVLGGYRKKSWVYHYVASLWL